MSDSDLTYRVQLWTDDGRSVFKTVARASHYTIATKAYDGALSAHPGTRISLSDGCRLLRRHVPQELKGKEAIPIYDILAAHNVPPGFVYVDPYRREGRATQIEFRTVNSEVVRITVSDARDLANAMSLNGYAEYAIPILKAVEEASS